MLGLEKMKKLFTSSQEERKKEQQENDKQEEISKITISTQEYNLIKKKKVLTDNEEVGKKLDSKKNNSPENTFAEQQRRFELLRKTNNLPPFEERKNSQSEASEELMFGMDDMETYKIEIPEGDLLSYQENIPPALTLISDKKKNVSLKPSADELEEDLLADDFFPVGRSFNNNDEIIIVSEEIEKAKIIPKSDDSKKQIATKKKITIGFDLQFPLEGFVEKDDDEENEINQFSDEEKTNESNSPISDNSKAQEQEEKKEEEFKVTLFAIDTSKIEGKEQEKQSVEKKDESKTEKAVQEFKNAIPRSWLSKSIDGISQIEATSPVDSRLTHSSFGERIKPSKSEEFTVGTAPVISQQKYRQRMFDEDYNFQANKPKQASSLNTMTGAKP